MKEQLRLTLLGSPQILLGDQPLTDFSTNKAQALLFYLGVTAYPDVSRPAPHSRDALATLLWGDMTDVKAKQNLRSVLPELRRLVGNHVRIERQIITFDATSPYWLDTAVFQDGLTLEPSPLSLAARQAAIDLYRGEFLSGFYVHKAPAFDFWVLEQRQKFHILAVKALFILVSEYIQSADYGAALAANRQLLSLEPWSEPAHRQQMLILAQMGERSAALAQFEACRNILAAEFGVEPLIETIALYKQIRAGDIEGSSDPSQGKVLVVKDPGQDAKDDQQVSQHATNPTSILVNERDLPQRIKLFGRQKTLVHLQKWVSEDNCHLIGIFGLGGQGKSALAAEFVHTLLESHLPSDKSKPGFRRIIWTSLLNAPPLAEVLQNWFYLLSEQTVTTLPDSLDQQFSQLLGYLRRQRSLLILDNLESILQTAGRSGSYRPGYEGYGQLIDHLAKGYHGSCLLFTSRERPRELTSLEKDVPAARFLSLTGLPPEAGREMLAARGVAGDATTLVDLTNHYSGNPLALKLVAQTIESLFAGNVTAFLQANAGIFDDIRDVLDQHFTRLTPLEREIMGWLAIGREPVSYQTLRDLLAQPPAPRQVLEAVRSLHRRSLLENYGDNFGLQNVVMEYTTAWLVDSICTELINEDWEPDVTKLSTRSFLNVYALVLAQQTKEYVRASQTRLLLQPVAEHLVAQLGSRGGEQRLQTVLAHLHTAAPAPGYAASNVLHLLLHLGVELRGYDFSQLYLRQLYLRGISLPQTNFAQAEVVDSVFTEPFGLVYTAVISPDGHYLAAGTSEGAIYLWRMADQQLAHVIDAHSHSVRALAFAQRTTTAGNTELVLASASDDQSIGLWSLATQEQDRWQLRLLDARQKALHAVGFAPGGQRVIGVDLDGQVFVWDVNAYQSYQLVQYFMATPTRFGIVAYSGDGQTMAVGNRKGVVQLRQVATGELELELTVETGSIVSLALSGNGRTLVTGGKAGHLCFWALPEGRLQQVIETKDAGIDALAFSADGKMVASTHSIGNQAIRLWGVDENQTQWRLRHTLLGHSSSIWSVAFGSLSTASAGGNATVRRHLLVTGSSDQTVRVWDVRTGQSLYTQRGQPRALSAIAIHPLSKTHSTPESRQEEDWLLATVGYDQLVHLWQGRGTQANATSRTLCGADKPLYAVAISPDNRILAAAGHNKIVYLWDIASGQLQQRLQGHTGIIECLVFHPDGELLASSSMDGMVHLWDLPKLMSHQEYGAGRSSPGQPAAVFRAKTRAVDKIAFSPDGRMLATVGADLSLSLWDMTQSHTPELANLRKTVQEAGEQRLFSVAFSPDGEKLACGSNYHIYLWDLYSDKPSQILRQHTSKGFSVAFSPDGTLLASSSADRTICLWDIARGSLCAVLRGHRGMVYNVAFSPDGGSLLSCSADGTIRFWDVPSGDCVNTLRVDGPYAGMNITGITGVTQAQKEALKALGAVEA